MGNTYSLIPFSSLKDLYSQSGTRFYLKEVFFSCGEGVLAKPLTQLQEEFETVQLGSYPDDSSRYSDIAGFNSVDIYMAHVAALFWHCLTLHHKR